MDRKSLGGGAGIIGAGGNVGAVAAGFVLKGTGDVQQTFAYLGGFVVLASLCAIAVRFSAEHKSREEALYQEAIAPRGVASSAPSGAMPAPGRACASPISPVENCTDRISENFSRRSWQGLRKTCAEGN